MKWIKTINEKERIKKKEKKEWEDSIEEKRERPNEVETDNEKEKDEVTLGKKRTKGNDGEEEQGERLHERREEMGSCEG